MRIRFTSALHEPRAAALLGSALGAGFVLCFLTGLASHVAYDQPSWWPIGPRPAGLYRVTQGVHVATGLACLPLLLVKLWVVYPALWTWPPVRSVAHAVERLSLLPLVGGSLFLLVSGAGNLARWRPWGFFFTDGHYHAAWVTIGALVVHVAAKGTEAARAIRRPAPAEGAMLTRRHLLAVAGAASAVLTVATVGQTLRPLAGVSRLAPRDPRVGPQGVPVNKTASAAGTTDLASRWRLRVVRAGEEIASLAIDDVRALPAVTAVLPIACVEGWSASARWRGVAVRDLLGWLQVDPDRLLVVSAEVGGRYRTSELAPAWLRDPHTLLAYDLGDEPLAPDHGAPLRLIAPNRPGVLQTKWVTRLEMA